jgi:polysaccharide deacetylase 2 family uncharacterized protein YibQ
MTADDLSAPLGQQPAKRRRKSPISISQVVAGALLLFLGVFVVWAIVGDNPFGGEPVVAVPIDLHAMPAAKKAEATPVPEIAPGVPAPGGHDAAANGSAPGSPAPGQSNALATKTVTIIDGKTGARQEVVIPDGGNAGDSASAPPLNQNFVEMTPRGPIPKIAADGTRPSEAFARQVKPLPGKADAPRIALIISGLGVSASGTAEAITKMPEAVTLAFMPYGSDVERLVARARGEGHEILLQVPLEPFGYPENDSGPQTLLTSLTPEQNLERLHWLMSRFQGYVGIVGAMGARFTASEQSFAPIMRETAKRGLIFVDDGANARSVAGRIAGGSSLAFAKADLVLDAVPTPAEIDHALGRLEMAARERSFAVGIASALPVSIEHIAKWAREAESRGVLLVPITVVAGKAKQS